MRKFQFFFLGSEGWNREEKQVWSSRLLYTIASIAKQPCHLPQWINAFKLDLYFMWCHCLKQKQPIFLFIFNILGRTYSSWIKEQSGLHSPYFYIFLCNGSFHLPQQPGSLSISPLIPKHILLPTTVGSTQTVGTKADDPSSSAEKKPFEVSTALAWN